MNSFPFKKLLNVIYTLGILTGIFAIGKIYYQRSQLPAGVCPVDQSRSLMVLSIALIGLYFVLDYGYKYISRKHT